MSSFGDRDSFAGGFQHPGFSDAQDAPARNPAHARDCADHVGAAPRCGGRASPPRVDLLMIEVIEGLTYSDLLTQQVELLLARSRQLRRRSAHLRQQCQELCIRLRAERERARQLLSTR